MAFEVPAIFLPSANLLNGIKLKVLKASILNTRLKRIESSACVLGCWEDRLNIWLAD